MGHSPFTPAAVVAEQVRSGVAGPTEAVEASLAAIAERDPKIRAFVTVLEDQARADAAALSQRPDLATLPLAGVPVAIKDVIPVAGLPMREGSTATSAEPRATDHAVVARLKAAGAVVVGLTTLPELAVWGSTDAPGHITRNPWNLSRTCGGSSGGAAAAVAAGMVPLSHGTDGLGSIRIPAANCGVFGIKPGRGVVPSELGATSWFGMAENGPLATTVGDAALMLSVLADRPDLARIGASEPLRIAVAAGSPTFLATVDPQWRDAAVRAGTELTGSGHDVEPATLPYPVNLLPVLARWTAGTAADAKGLDRRQLQPRTRRHVALGRALGRFVRPEQVDKLEESLREFFEKYDVVVTPALAQPPLAATAWSERSWASNVVANVRYAPFSALWNLVGWPAASVPVGTHSHSGTPLAVQIAAPPGGEARILALAAHIERVGGWPRVAPAR
ncbi:MULTISPECIES: amidase [unclassified Rhodococcus (in: high G+C Gram-positive bacteria)]|uniref:amidase n=1 Tax=unclassified Rhodococcus (in: high G+C Gram-positive bacteria) TaxID=192944 RepID=UPI00163A8B3D|nr:MULTISPECIES: amidase [unclassified Rhodococcus (in: high G+C Gram-positive bacteria)]MBC2641683.1 amidase [Rhodococcus sp. 3A]MBC2893572.1 amidase [Rhodococcus sp. 4CII]